MAIVILLLGIIIRLFGIEDHSFWFDEGLEIGRARIRWPALLTLDQGPDPPLLRVILAPLARHTTRELWLRLPPALASIAAIGLAYRWVATLGDHRLALVFAAVVALSPVHVYYAQEVSQYSLVICLTVGLLLFGALVMKRGRSRDWMSLGIVSVLSLLSYYGLVFVVIAVNTYLAVFAWRRGLRRHLVWSMASAVLLFGLGATLYFVMLEVQLDRFRHTLTALFVTQPIPTAIALLGRRTEYDVVRFLAFPWAPTAPRALVIIPIVLVVGGIVNLWRRGGLWRSPAILLFSTFGLMCIAHGVGLYPFGFRYGLFLSPLLLLPVAAALTCMARWGLPGLLLLGVLIGGWTTFLPNAGAWRNGWVAPPYENLRPILEYVDAESAGSDLVYLYYGAVPAYRAYRPRSSRPITVGVPFRELPPEQQVASVRRSMKGVRRFWLIMSHIYGSEKEVLFNGLQTGEPRFVLADQITDLGAAGGLFVAADETTSLPEAQVGPAH